MCYPHVIHMLSVYYPYVIHMLSMCYPYVIHMSSMLLLVCYLYATCMFSVCYPFGVNIISTAHPCVIHVLSMSVLSTCRRPASAAPSWRQFASSCCLQLLAFRGSGQVKEGHVHFLVPRACRLTTQALLARRNKAKGGQSARLAASRMGMNPPGLLSSGTGGDGSALLVHRLARATRIQSISPHKG